MGVASRVQEAFKMQLLSLLPLLCIVSAAPEGGLLGFGLLGGDSSTNTTTTTTAPITTTTASPATTTALVEALTSTTAASSDNTGIIQNLIDVLTGKVATIALDHHHGGEQRQHWNHPEPDRRSHRQGCNYRP